MKFRIQYAAIGNSPYSDPSTWGPERSKTVEAENRNAAQKTFHAWAQHLGAWTILDCYEENQ